MNKCLRSNHSAVHKGKPVTCRDERRGGFTVKEAQRFVHTPAQELNVIASDQVRISDEQVWHNLCIITLSVHHHHDSFHHNSFLRLAASEKTESITSDQSESSVQQHHELRG